MVHVSMTFCDSHSHNGPRRPGIRQKLFSLSSLHVYAMCCPSSPPRNASNARTSCTYCKPSSIGTRCMRSVSVGSLIQPWMGIALSRPLLACGPQYSTNESILTLVE